MIHTMKKTFKYIAFGIAFLASSFALNAQDPYNTKGTYNKEGGMATSKKVEGPEGGYYTITLESFATGKSTVTETATPVDIVLVLDVSGSMEDNVSIYSYDGTTRGWTYNNYGNYTRYYLHTDGKYYEVSIDHNNWGNRVSFSVDGTTWYLTAAGATTDRPDRVGNSATFFSGTLYTRSVVSTQSKIDALKTAVQTFVNTVNHNAHYDKNNKERSTVLHNRISVVKYAVNQYCKGDTAGGTTIEGQYYNDITPGNHTYYASGWGWEADYNYTEVLVGFTDVSTTDGMNQVMGNGAYEGVLDLEPGGATASDFGMTKAKYLLESVKNDDSNKVVVLFTDGSPTYGQNFDPDVAGNTIEVAHSLKQDYDATVFTIGVFDNETEQIRNYMNWTSSNYPEAEGWNDEGTGSDQGYYQNASNANLDDIFKAVAEASSESDATAGASTEVRDVVSNSFIMP